MALTGSRLGPRTAVTANDAASTSTASTTRSRLHPGARTPTLTVITDDAGTRTWFAYLKPALAALDTVELTPLARARLATSIATGPA